MHLAGYIRRTKCLQCGLICQCFLAHDKFVWIIIVLAEYVSRFIVVH